MSLSYSVKTVVDNVVHQFILKVAEKYDLDANELLVEWEGEGCGNIKPSENVNNDLDHSKILNMKVPELKALCKKKGLKATGKKEELISLILKGETSSTMVKAETKPPKTKLLTPTVVKRLSNVNSTVAIRKNAHGNHEHPETTFVFDPKTKKVIGKQNENGKVDPLTEEDIDICNKYKFLYVLPDNLDNNAKLEDEHVEELDEDEDEDVIDSEDEIDLDEDELIDDDEDIELDEDEIEFDE
jgi:Fe2+ or Zn2+ uptake regulation protein